MKCNKCGLEFGKGETCQHCGADKVSALGEFTGYSSLRHNSENVTKATSSPITTHLEPVTSQICWKCGEIIPLGHFCPACGQQLLRKCPKCKKSYSAKYSICPNCGTNYFTYQPSMQEQLLHKKLEKEITYPDYRDAYNEHFWGSTTRLNYEPLPRELKRTAGPSLESRYYYKGFRLTGSVGSPVRFIVFLVDGQIVHIQTYWDDYNCHAAFDYFFNNAGVLERRLIRNPETGPFDDRVRRFIKGGKSFVEIIPIESIIEILDNVKVIGEDEMNN